MCMLYELQWGTHMAVETRDITAGPGDHLVQFYEHDSELTGAVGPYLAAAVRAGEVAIVIATEPHRRAFDAALEGEGIDLAAARADGALFALDAAGAMAALMVDGRIDHRLFHEVVGGLVREAAASGRAVRAYGEMVALLWNAGDVLAAIELERLWNDLARELQFSFSLFCSYPMTSVAGAEHAVSLQQVCHLHSEVLGLRSGAGPEPGDRLLEVEFNAERGAPGHARRLVRATLRERGHSETFSDDVALVVSELASNAVLHAESPFSVAIRAEESLLRVAVQDGVPLAATARGGELIAHPMHGLGLIDALATSWGVESTDDGKVVWAELSCALPTATALADE
jgi:anti-sigma regulatory factor (Ser/Thr protein kinase)